MSRSLLPQGSRHLPPRLILGVRQKYMNPLFNSAGYTLKDRVLRVLQVEGWVEVPLCEVSELKMPSASSVIVRLSDGRRKVLNLTRLSVDGYRDVTTALKDAIRSRKAPPNRNQKNEN